jgi:hypothetical protein
MLIIAPSILASTGRGRVGSVFTAVAMACVICPMKAMLEEGPEIEKVLANVDYSFNRPENVTKEAGFLFICKRNGPHSVHCVFELDLSSRVIST